MSRQIVSKTTFDTVRSWHVSSAMPLTNPLAGQRQASSTFATDRLGSIVVQAVVLTDPL